MATPEDLRQILRLRGILSAGDLAKELNVSRATLSRHLMASEAIRWGKVRGTRYGLPRILSDIGWELGLFRVNELGKLMPAGKLCLFHARKYLWRPEEREFDGPPPEIADMAPQGFMGRAFVHKHADLDLPPRLQDWSDDHVIRAIALRGEDLHGNLIIGEKSAERWQKLGPPKLISRARYPEMARAAFAGQPAGSSAGGEQSKFSSFVEGKHRLVKFALADSSEEQSRWRDLLRCEHHALSTLRENDILTAETSLHEIEGMVFLEVVRFDRKGARGRSPMLSLAVVCDSELGGRSDWTKTADQLERRRLLAKADADRLRLLDLYGKLIADSDRHPHNISLIPASEKDFRLAPAYDKLPMFFSPVNGKVLARDFLPDIAVGVDAALLKKTLKLANEFWDRACSDKKISAKFRKICAAAQKAIQIYG